MIVTSPLQIETGLRVNHLSWKYRDICDILAARAGTLKGTSLKKLCSVIEEGKTVAGKNVQSAGTLGLDNDGTEELRTCQSVSASPTVMNTLLKSSWCNSTSCEPVTLTAGNGNH